MTTAATFRAIRRRLGVSQAVLARAMDCTAVNVLYYERGQQIPPERAQLLITFANARGLAISFDHVYGGRELPEMPRSMA